MELERNGHACIRFGMDGWELKPCPFCGSNKVNVYEYKYHGLTDSFGVKCFNCKTESYQFFDSKNEAIEAWNRRAKNEM